MNVTELMIDLLTIDSTEWFWLFVLALPALIFHAYVSFID